MKCYCVVLWPCDFIDLWRLNPKTVPLLAYPKVIPYTKLNTLGLFVFELCCRQTDELENPTTPTDRVGVGSDNCQMACGKWGECEADWLGRSWWKEMKSWFQWLWSAYQIKTSNEWFLKRNLWRLSDSDNVWEARATRDSMESSCIMYRYISWVVACKKSITI